jgi:hypothetical protein
LGKSVRWIDRNISAREFLDWHEYDRRVGLSDASLQLAIIASILYNAHRPKGSTARGPEKYMAPWQPPDVLDPPRTLEQRIAQVRAFAGQCNANLVASKTLDRRSKGAKAP